MSDVYFRGAVGHVEKVSLDEGETVLDGLLRSGIDVPFGCRTGVCQGCLLKSKDCEVPQEAQKGLNDSQKQQGHFLSCCCLPKEPMIVALSSLYKKQTAQVVDKKFLSNQVVRIRVNKVFCYRPGQYVTLWKDHETARSYSIASHPTEDDFIEMHIRVYENGAFSQWAYNMLSVGEELSIQGPMGDCFYDGNNKGQTLFMSGIGTGLAPLYGIARDALLRGHTGNILMLIGAGTKAGLYYQHKFKELQSCYPQLEVKYSVASLNSKEMALEGHASDIYTTAKVLLPDMTGVKVYLCGGENFVRKMRKQSFLAGANMGDIASDSFICFAD